MAYTDIEEIGRGGFGIVHKVKDSDGQLFAMKYLNVPAGQNPTDMTKRFVREVKYQGAISHNNVVRIVEFDLTSNPPWFVMPLATESLKDELMRDRHMGGNAQEALFHILSGLEEIHRLGYLHRDLKPANILKFAGPDNSNLYALSDFGLVSASDTDSTTLTPSGIGGGTPRYQAPECAINFHRATNRSDIYSFGALLHDIFAASPHRLPHDELTCHGLIGPVIEKCTKRNSHRRFSSVSELREALFDALNSGNVTYVSDEHSDIISFLTNSATLPSNEQWDRIFDYIDVNIENADIVAPIFRAIRQDHIIQLYHDDMGLFAALGKFYANYCREGTFDFDYCDVLASKAGLFYQHGELGLQASIAVAVLFLGTSHNRWFVESKFMQMASPNISNELAQRIAVECEVNNISFAEQFDRLRTSISAKNSELHPHLLALLPA